MGLSDLGYSLGEAGKRALVIGPRYDDAAFDNELCALRSRDDKLWACAVRDAFKRISDCARFACSRKAFQ